MKVLIAAITCHPTAGSEAYVGWQAVSLLRQEHELWVLTSLWCKQAIEEAVASEEGWEKVHFIYVDEHLGERPPHPNRLIARIQSWTRYRSWIHDARWCALRLKNEVNFDLAHHVTYASWRMGSPLAGIGLPWVWGPIGGGERFPLHLFGMLSLTSKIFEIVRAANTAVMRISPGVRLAVKDATIIIPNNQETLKLLGKMGVDEGHMKILSQSFLTRGKLNLFSAVHKTSPRCAGYLSLVAGGNLEGRKGVSLVIDALLLLKKKRIPFRFIYLGKGPEEEYLKKRVEDLDLSREVVFKSFLHGDEYSEHLKHAHAYVLPSLREGVPLTQMEAMAAGCVPVVAECGGASPMARLAGANVIQVASRNVMISEISRLLSMLWNNEALWRERSDAAVRAITEHYSESAYIREMKEVYAIAGTA
ncbi:MAG: glycosyltransferase [Verrucomicrobia bacterium]|nr:glycosyltransferase [Verrucomicrobiota bacterium]